MFFTKSDIPSPTQLEFVQPTRRLTAQELERMTQSLYERSVLEVKAEWKRRFSAELRQQFDRVQS